MPANEHQESHGAGRGSGIRAFWSSLPGVLTGTAAVVTAIGTLVALDVGGEGSGRAPAGPPAAATSTAQPATGGADCLSSYFAGIPADRIDDVETGTTDFDAIAAHQPKRGTIGLRFTEFEKAIGGMRLAYIPSNQLFKIESIADASCSPVAGHENISRGGDPDVLQNWDTLRFPLGGQSYDMRIGESSTIRLSFTPYAE